MEVAEPDTGSNVHAYYRKLRSNEDRKCTIFISLKMLNMVNLHRALKVFGKLYDE